MNDSNWYTYAALAIAVAVLGGFSAGMALGWNEGAATQGPGSPSVTTAADYVNLTVAWNPTSGLDEFFPANFTVPAHTVVHISITNYDDGVNVVDPAYAAVAGTFGGTEKVTNATGSETLSTIAVGEIAHTFTVLTMPGSSGGGPALNAFVPAAPSVSSPVTVSFTTEFNTTGAITWECLAQCDGTAMVTSGLMTGTISVV